MKPSFTKALLMLLALSILSACVTKPAPTTRYYMLTSTPASQTGVKSNSPVIEIAALRLPQYLDRPQMVTRPTPQRLEIHETHRWGDNLRNNLERVLADNLSQVLSTSQVLIVPHLSPRVDYRLMVEVQQYERVHDDRVVLQAQWSLFEEGEPTPLAGNNTRFVHTLASDAGMEEVVAAMSLLFARLAEDIAAPLTADR